MKAVEFGPGWIRLKGRQFKIPKPTTADLQRIGERMRELAVPAVTHPVLAVNAIADDLKPGVLDRMLAIAGRASWGGPVEPSDDAVKRQFGTLAGLRFQLWYMATRDESQKSLTPEEVESLVTEAERYDLADALEVATGLRKLEAEEGDPKASPAGAS